MPGGPLILERLTQEAVHLQQRGLIYIAVARIKAAGWPSNTINSIPLLPFQPSAVLMLSFGPPPFELAIGLDRSDRKIDLFLIEPATGRHSTA